jgi:DNA modification methylase
MRDRAGVLNVATARSRTRRSQRGSQGSVTSIQDLTPDPENRRLHNPGNLGMITEFLKAVGAARSIAIDEDDVVLAGNGVVAAATADGMTKVRVIEAQGNEIIAVRRRGLTPAQKLALAIYDNRTAELAGWNIPQLHADLASGLAIAPFFSAAELKALFAKGEGPATGRTDADDVPPQRATGIQRGDLFELGRHRLLCGDSTTQADVARTLGAVVADLLLTDPLYGVAYQTKLSVEEAAVRHRRRDGLELANDAMSPEETREFLAQALGVVREHLKPGGAFYVCSPAGDMELRFRLALLDANLALHQEIVWIKDMFVMGRQDYHWRHETLLYGWKEGAAHHFIDDRTQDTVWECARPKRSEAHPTMKPVELMARAIRNSSRANETVVDPFSGGTTLMASEQTSRRCFALEIDPVYVQVAIDRWEAFTGQKATKVGESALGVRSRGIA